MDDPTKDTIPRSAVEYCLRKETVNTNPDAYEAHERFIAYVDDPDIAQFGHWMHSNGFNCALTAIAVDLDKIPSVTPKEQKWIPVTERLPEEKINPNTQDYDWVLCSTTFSDVRAYHFGRGRFLHGCGDVTQYVTAWMPLPEPWKEGGE